MTRNGQIITISCVGQLYRGQKQEKLGFCIAELPKRLLKSFLGSIRAKEMVTVKTDEGWNRAKDRILKWNDDKWKNNKKNFFWHHAFLGVSKFYCLSGQLYNKTKNQCLDKKKGRPHPNIDPVTINKIRKYLKPQSIKLFQFLKKMPFWEI